ncbi:MAG: glycosyltransferase family 4 protein [Chthoniobacterales bacterium]|nr:glycosyltransferase family 4 protein [Chthoniobacterales bacterium]
MGLEPALIGSGWPREEWPWGEWINLKAKGPVHFARKVHRERIRRIQNGIQELFFSLERVPGCDIYRAGDGVHLSWLKRRKTFEPLWRWLLRTLFGWKHRQLLKLEKQVFNQKNTGIVIANSSLVASEVIDFYSFPENRIRIILNGIEEKLSGIGEEEWLKKRQIWRREMGVRDEEIIALFVGSGWERKGLKFAIQALCRCENGVVFWVVGKGRQNQFKDKRVFFWGPQKELTQFWTCADFFLLPTWYDPFSNACLEALAAGLPVITTRDNGVAEILQEGETGSVVSRADAVEELRLKCISWIQKIRDEAKKVKQKCLEVAKLYSIQRNVEQTFGVMNEAWEFSLKQAKDG